MPYWIQSTLAATPALAWMFLGLGFPWALVVLPRRDWRDWPTVACLTLAFGPAFVTAWMFALGSFGQPWITLINTLAGTAVLAAVGWAWVWRKRQPHPLRTSSVQPSPLYGEEKQNHALRFDEKLLLILIGIALIVRWIGVAYWPSTAYDALWVYAYEGKLYTLLGYIPNTIGYYPQFLPLQHTYLQLAVGGLDDHAARAVLPWLHLGSIFAAYLLGKRLFNRRVGIYVAAIWALYPHVGEWSRYGDLEIPIAFLFTAGAAFFLQAWNSPQPSAVSFQPKDDSYRRRYAIIAGLLLGVGMWTKPTMGAFIWGVILLVVIEFCRKGIQVNVPTNRFREAIQAAWPRIQVAMVTGLASIPLGAVWYIRNYLNGHNPIDLPPAYWQTQAARSGVEFGWPLLALLLLIAYLWWHNRNSFPKMPVLIGLVLVLAGLLPSIYNTGRVGIIENRMGAFEWLSLGAGGAILCIALWRWAADRWTEEGRRAVAMIGWALALALPYFVTWFFSYSYHYRLSFAIVPLLILPTAVILAKWTERFSPQRHRGHREESQSENSRSSPFSGLVVAGSRTALASGGLRQTVWLIAITALAIPGIIAPLYDVNAGWDWLWTDKLPDDHARYASGNAALMTVVDGLQAYLDTRDEPLSVVAPGIERLPFFFPLEDIQIGAMPTRLDDLEGMTYFVYGTPESGGDVNTFTPGQNPVLDILALATDDESDTKSVLRRAWWADDGIFKYTVYELHLERRWQQPEVTIPPEGDVVFGGFLRYLGYDTIDHSWWKGRKLTMNFFWQVLQQPAADYVVYIQLRDSGGNLWMAWDAPITRTDDGNYYSSLVWEPGEYIIDRRILEMTNRETPLGDNYQLVIGLYDRAGVQRVPVTIDGRPAGDGYTLTRPFAMIPGEE